MTTRAVRAEEVIKREFKRKKRMKI